jgi:hypothetical protein
MLQPLQLKDVSVRYPQEIAELRDFLAKSGCALGSAECLRDIAGRLRQDRGFRRDLTLYVWVVMDGNGQISYPDLLGIVAIAAAGRFAAQADENDAHDLLRFLMDARRSLQRTPEAAPARPAAAPVLPPAPVLPIAPVAPLAAEPFPAAIPEPVRASSVREGEEVTPARPQLVRDEVRVASPTPIRPIADPTPVAARAAVRDEDDERDVLPVRSQPFRSQYAPVEEPEESDDTGKRLAWAVAALCLLVGLGVGVMKYMHRTPEDRSVAVDSATETGTNASGGSNSGPARRLRESRTRGIPGPPSPQRVIRVPMQTVRPMRRHLALLRPTPRPLRVIRLLPVTARPSLRRSRMRPSLWPQVMQLPLQRARSLLRPLH